MDGYNDKADDVYSTTETKTNKVWIDGKPIYRKCYYSATNWSNGTILDTINDVDFCVELKSISASGSNNYFQNGDDTNSYGDIFFNVANKRLMVRRIGDFISQYPSAVIFEYTKTT